MRLVLDTNVVIAGLLWNGAPRQIIDRAIDDATIELFSCPALIAELTNTLRYAKFARRIEIFGTRIAALVAQYQALVALVKPSHVPRVVIDDADDDQVLACATTARADLIVSGDRHLHRLGDHYHGIRIVTPAAALDMIDAR